MPETPTTFQINNIPGNQYGKCWVVLINNSYSGYFTTTEMDNIINAGNKNTDDTNCNGRFNPLIIGALLKKDQEEMDNLIGALLKKDQEDEEDEEDDDDEEDEEDEEDDDDDNDEEEISLGRNDLMVGLVPAIVKLFGTFEIEQLDTSDYSQSESIVIDKHKLNTSIITTILATNASDKDKIECIQTILMDKNIEAYDVKLKLLQDFMNKLV